MRTSARREGDDYVISGQKLWARARARRATSSNVYVNRSEGDIRQGMSLFLVDNTAKGLELKKLDMLDAVHRHLRDLFDDACASAGAASSAARTGAGTAFSQGFRPSDHFAAGNIGAAQGLPRPRSRSRKERKTSAARSARTRRSRTCSPTWRRGGTARALTWRPRGWRERRGRAARDLDGEALLLRGLRECANLACRSSAGYGYSMESTCSAITATRARDHRRGTSQDAAEHHRGPHGPEGVNRFLLPVGHSIRRAPEPPAPG